MKSVLSLSVAAAVALAVSVSAAPQVKCSRSATDAPSVDLGYELHLGTVNTTGDYYLFNSIPYAQQPVGDLRFQKPVAITGKSSEVNNGTSNIICMQAYPEWIIELYAAGYGVDPVTMAGILTSAAGQTESCLVLDVYVPRDIFEKGAVAEAPVLLWIHGGGFTYGSKLSAGNPSGLLARSKLNGEEGMIVVTINYRLGLFGWLGGADDITPNLGLYDQLAALQWVQQHIAAFGGSPDRVTVMGESAGASSILHHITGYGGAAKAPFAAAIPQSPAFQFNLNATASYLLTMKAAAEVVTGSTTATGVASLMGIESETLKEINQAVVQPAGTGKFNFGPVVDGTYVPKLPQVLLSDGKFDSSIKIMTSHTSNESVPFVPTTIATPADVRSYLENATPEASSATLDYMLTTVWPDISNTTTWKTQFARTAQIVTDTSFACSTRFLATALGPENAHAYIYAYPPGYHQADVAYVFFNGDTSTLNDGAPVDAALASAMQDYIVRFVVTGSPDGVVGLPAFPAYGEGARVMEFSAAGAGVGVDDMDNERCGWVQRAMAEGLI